MESEACVTSLSRSDLNSAFCDTSQSDKCSADSLSFDSSGRDCTCASTTDVSTNNSNEHTGPELSQSQVTHSPTKQSNSIYLDNGTDHHHAKPLTPKLKKTRLTMAERARIEAMASFGGAPLESVLKKHESFKDKLQKQKDALKAQCKKDASTETDPCTSKDSGTFNSSLSDLQVKRVDFKSRLKEEEADQDKENTLLPPASKSRHQLAHEQSQAGFSFEDCVKREGRDGLPSFRKNAQNTNPEGGAKPNVKRMTKVERSKMEALQSFGASLQDLTVKPKIPKVMEEKLSLKRKLNNH